MSGARRLREQDEEVTRRLDDALERLQDANARQHAARERLGSDRPLARSEEELDLDRALDAGSGPRLAVG